VGVKFSVKSTAAEGNDFEYIGRIRKFRYQDSDAEHKQAIGADPDTEILQLVVEVEGVSIEWTGDLGNVYPPFTADVMTKTGEFKKGRNHKAFHILAPIIAPEDEEEARAIVDEKGRQVFVTRGRGGVETVITGLGYDEDAPDFPEKLEGKVFKLAHRWVEFGINKDTKLPIRSQLPILLEELPDDYVFEGDAPKVTYKTRTPTAREDGESTGGDSGVDPEPADTQDFFDAIEGRRLQLADLNEACAAPSLRVEPYRTLVATRSGRNALVDKGYISIGDDKTITVENVPSLDELLATAEEVQEALAK